MDSISPKPIASIVERYALHAVRVVAIGSSCAWLVVAVGLPGCATWGRRPAVSSTMSECRNLSRLGNEAIEQGDRARGEELLRNAMAANPADSEVPRQLAEIVWGRGERSEAIRLMETAYRLAPHDISLAVRSGQMNLVSGKTARAIRWADRAIGLDANHAPAWALRGHAYFASKDIERALADLYRALSDAPGEAEVLLKIAQIHRTQAHPHRCLTTTQQLLDLYSPGEEPRDVLYLEGLALADLGRHRDAADSLIAASSRGPPHADVLHALARSQWKSGQRSAALASGRKALAVDARHAPTIALLAELNSSVELDQDVLRK